MAVSHGLGALNEAEWLRERLTLITGSDSAAILGVSPFLSPLALYALKIGAAVDWDSLAKRRGRQLERATLEILDSEVLRPKGWRLEIPEPFSLVKNKSLPWMACTPDAYAWDKAGDQYVVEAKIEIAGDERAGPKPHHLAQLQHNMAVCGVDRGILAVLSGVFRFRHSMMAKNPEFVASMVAQEQAFLSRVVERRPPPPDDSESAMKALNVLYPSPDEKVIQLPEEAVEAWDALEGYRREAGQIDRRRRRVGNLLRYWMGPHRFGRMSDGRILELLAYQQKISTRTMRRLKLRSSRRES